MKMYQNLTGINSPIYSLQKRCLVAVIFVCLDIREATSRKIELDSDYNTDMDTNKTYK